MTMLTEKARWCLESVAYISFRQCLLAYSGGVTKPSFLSIYSGTKAAAELRTEARNPGLLNKQLNNQYLKIAI